jgi:Methyltransferase domain
MSPVQRYTRYRRLMVQGWLDRGACDMITRVADAQQINGIRGNMAEIGVHHGRLFILLALLRRSDEAALAIDLFGNQDLNIDQSGKGDYDRLMANLKRHVGDTAQIVIHQGDSTTLSGETVRQLAGGAVRFFSIDGGHTESITKHDLETAEQAIGEGGVIILDDCFNSGWPGVVTGVARFLEGHHVVRPFAIGSNKTLFASEEYCRIYQKTLLTSNAKIGTHSFFGHEVLCLEYANLGITWVRHSSLWQQFKDTKQGQRLKNAYYKFETMKPW